MNFGDAMLTAFGKKLIKQDTRALLISITVEDTNFFGKLEILWLMIKKWGFHI